MIPVTGLAFWSGETNALGASVQFLVSWVEEREAVPGRTDRGA